uniref:RING-type domain-containing protein n=1 Tax=Salarias fasciatus TaxID=181472 RepID=A0A672FLK9_SALFA
MSLQSQVEERPEERRAFFIGADWDNVSEEEEEDHHQLILHKANALASQNCLKEAIDWFSVAMRYEPARPEQLSTFVDCILRNFKSKVSGPEASPDRSRDAGDGSGEHVFTCPSCRGFLGEAVTVACGHSYCKRCLQRRLFSKCKLCAEPVSGEEKANVILCGLLDKWFPDELKQSKTLGEVDALCRRKRYKEAVALATDVIQSVKLGTEKQSLIKA